MRLPLSQVAIGLYDFSVIYGPILNRFTFGKPSSVKKAIFVSRHTFLPSGIPRTKASKSAHLCTVGHPKPKHMQQGFWLIGGVVAGADLPGGSGTAAHNKGCVPGMHCLI